MRWRWCCSTTCPLLGNVIAFQDYQPYLGIRESEWVGVSNFSFLWDGNPEFLNALWNTLILTVIQTVLVFPVPLVLALLLNSLAGERLKRLLQSILYLPHFLSWVIVVALFQQMLGNAGMLNTFLVQNDLPIVQIIGVPELFKALVTSQVIWKDAGWGTIIFLAAISRIDQEQYEAAAVDGAVGVAADVTSPCRHSRACSSCCSSCGSAAACRSASSRSSCSRDRSACRPARCSTPASTTTASSAATGASRPRPAWSRAWSACCS